MLQRIHFMHARIRHDYPLDATAAAAAAAGVITVDAAVALVIGYLCCCIPIPLCTE